jgi:hypothetical protein
MTDGKIYVHGYRSNNTIELVTEIVETGKHYYDGQAEEVIKAKTKKHPRARWYVGYGGDYIPANSTDIENILH